MKKILSLALASATALSIASVAFASGNNVEVAMSGISSTPCLYNSTTKLVDVKEDKDIIKYGDTVFFPIVGVITETGIEANPALLSDDILVKDQRYVIYEAAAVKGLKLKDSWEIGNKYVDNVTVVKKKAAMDVLKAVNSETTGGNDVISPLSRSYAYFVAVKLKDNMRASSSDVFGTISFDKKETKNSAGVSNDDGFKFKEDKIDISFEVELETNKGSGSTFEIGKERKVVEFPKDDDEVVLELVNDKTATFTFDARGQGKLVLSADNNFNSAVSRKYPMANLEFINIKASDSFNKMGELRIFTSGKNSLYALDENGELTSVKSKYDSDDDCYIIRTRKLNSFVISDVKLELAKNTAEQAAPAAPELKPVAKPNAKPFNPSTGAIC